MYSVLCHLGEDVKNDSVFRGSEVFVHCCAVSTFVSEIFKMIELLDRKKSIRDNN